MKRAKPRPGRASRKTKIIEPIGLVAFDARGKDFTFPRARGGLVAFELRDDHAERVGSFHARGSNALPGEKEAHEVACRNRLDLRAQTLDRVVMDACKQ